MSRDSWPDLPDLPKRPLSGSPVYLTCSLYMIQDVVDGKEIQTSSGLRYTDVKIGGGSPVQRGFLVVLDYK